MKTLLSITVSLSILLLAACGNHDHAHHEDAAQETTEHHDGVEDELKTNNGQPWQANAETTSGIANMNAIVAAFSDTSAASYLQLRDALEAEFATIFKLCPMEGEAHDQLHNYLLPLKRYFNLLKSENANERAEGLEKLKAHLAEYPTYFK